MSGSGKGLLGLWLYRSGEQEWAVKEGSPLHKRKEMLVCILYICIKVNSFGIFPLIMHSYILKKVTTVVIGRLNSTF